MTAEIKKSILIVDDDSFLLSMYREKFKKAGFDVRLAENGDKALEILRGEDPPAVVMIDIVMPGMDGLELLSQIRNEKLAASSLIVFLTNQGAREDIEKARSLGAAGYIVKASTIPSEVVAEVERILKTRNK
jgi:two-component system phosphate regulon response regulator PhoB